jgi:putative FmdB family regulatory protein
MPIYEYKCENGHTFEAMQRMSDDPLTECSICGAPVQRVFHPVAIHFKGSGFYNTDYGKRKRGAAAKEDGAAPKSDSSGSDSSKSESSKSESKPESKPAASSSSSD